MKRSIRIVRTVKKNIHEETEAINDYHKAAKTADPKTAKLYRHIAKDETHHRKELKKRLEQIK